MLSLALSAADLCYPASISEIDILYRRESALDRLPWPAMPDTISS
jgi:hypothetical protein